MKTTLFTILIASLSIVNSFAGDQLDKSERQFAISSLVETQSNLLKKVKGLSDTQLNFKTSDESWSIAQCIEHIAISESFLWQSVDMSLQPDADPAKRDELKFSDEQIIVMATSREQKVKTLPALQPKNSFGSTAQSVEEFKTKRKVHIQYVKKTEDDLRNHYFEFPFGLTDTYQVILFMSAHSARHTAQIEEIMNQANFPKN